MPRKKGRAVKNYQALACKLLKDIFGECNVKKEWDVAKESEDDLTRDSYCPRVDVAVGPFNLTRNGNNLRQIDEMIEQRRGFLKKLFEFSEIHSLVSRELGFEKFLNIRNENPRCLLAIEIENSGSSKHMLGNIANVSILGAIGVVIPFNDTKLKLCKRIKKYLKHAIIVKKIPKDIFRNVIIIEKNNFKKAFRN